MQCFGFGDRLSKIAVTSLSSRGTGGAGGKGLKAVEQVGSPADGRAVVAAMKATPVDDPLFGRVSIREDGRAMHPMYLLQVKTPAESKGEWDVFKVTGTIPADKTFRPLNEGGCPLVAKKD